MKFLFFGILQGITEFLPISSSGHLYLLKHILSFDENLLSFFVFLHIPSLLAIILFFRRQIIFFIFKKKLLLHILIITAITAFIGLFIKNFLKNIMEEKYFVSLCFIINSIILLSTRYYNKKKPIEDIELKDTLIFGFLQGLSVFYGISRSGITIFALLKRRFNPQDAFIFSFLMAIPVILGAFVFEFNELSRLKISQLDLGITFIVTLFVSITMLYLLKRVILASKFKNFGYYCILLSFVSLFV